MSDGHSRYYGGLDKLMTERNFSCRLANDVLYLRQQPRHTPELEEEFIQKAGEGEIPNVLTFGLQ